MKTWIFVTLSVLALHAGAQTSLPVPGDFTPPSSNDGYQPPAVKPIEPGTSVSTEEPAVEAKPSVTTDKGQGQKTQSHDRAPRPKVDVPAAPPVSGQNAIYLKWIKAIDMCTPQEGASRYEIIACPSYAVAGIRYALEDPSLRSALSEFDWVQSPIGGGVTLSRIYGTLKNVVTYETGVQAVACASSQGNLTQFVIGRRDSVLSWIRTVR
ncbi:MAG TPA: hypothetical protein PL182_09020 [Pseudobdellovibrionaceae bacterium]|nr:hypothetical protein [Pseudobdellovibrionaceae bacterium]